jgi:ectoine hydroxylase-related dioxygenase (phytanoyl-CoA dioxygenase family)
LVIATMWAMSDFTHSNGATLLVPGSHRWQTGRQATPDEVAQADMPEGSVMIWLGGTLHAAGGNSSNEWRYGIILSYSLGWLRQEENQYLSLPPALAKNVSDEVRELVGYPMHGSLGFYDPRIAKI